ncbi:hypothetical protein WH47_03847 [Habropoda laboriosa]|uniref:Uncharacterized protein n=1 Tax=Habropoda laboriosa TaxID=597456 RepID=A0A0L7QV49_9HYME|nr:hypothetical protein WH47_03847 [Habropoda laboriosa]
MNHRRDGSSIENDKMESVEKMCTKNTVKKKKKHEEPEEGCCLLCRNRDQDQLNVLKLIDANNLFYGGFLDTSVLTVVR